MKSTKIFANVFISLFAFSFQTFAQKKIKANSFQYAVNVFTGGQIMSMEGKKTIQEKEGKWVITQTLSAGINQAEDAFTIIKKDLSPSSRTMSEGPVNLKVAYTPKEISGSIEANGETQKIKHAPQNTLLADGPAIFESLTNLPLKVGYEKTYYIYDLQAKAERAYTIKVLKEEMAKVAGGEFKTLKCQIKPADDTAFTTLFSGAATVWLSMEEGKASLIKYTADLPSDQGTVEIELSK